MSMKTLVVAEYIRFDRLTKTLERLLLRRLDSARVKPNKTV